MPGETALVLALRRLSKAGRFLRVQSQPGLLNKFQARAEEEVGMLWVEETRKNKA